MKLEKYDIMERELDWFVSYFQNCRQFVVYERWKITSRICVNYGVAQRSIVRPIQYIIYNYECLLNDIVRYSDKLKFIMYTNICTGSTAQSFTTLKLLTSHDTYKYVILVKSFSVIKRRDIVISCFFFQIIFLITITQEDLWLMLKYLIYSARFHLSSSQWANGLSIQMNHTLERPSCWTPYHQSTKYSQI